MVDQGLFCGPVFHRGYGGDVRYQPYQYSLYAIALNLLRPGYQAPGAYSMTASKTHLVNWFTQTKSQTYAKQLKTWTWGPLVISLSSLQPSCKVEEPFRKDIIATFQRRVYLSWPNKLTGWRRQFRLLQEREVLVIIDDLNKPYLSVVKSIFQDNIKALFLPKIRVVFTIPMSVMRDPRSVSNLGTLKVICW